MEQFLKYDVQNHCTICLQIDKTQIIYRLLEFKVIHNVIVRQET